MICPKCSYSWEPRLPNPKVCPRCKANIMLVIVVIGIIYLVCYYYY